MTLPVIGSAGRAEDSDDLEIRIMAGARRCYRVLAADVPAVLAGYPGMLYAGDPEAADPAGDVESSASGLVLLGASRAGRGFAVTFPSGAPLPVDAPEWIIPRDHLRAHYHRHDGSIAVLGVD